MKNKINLDTTRAQREFNITVTRSGYNRWKKYGMSYSFLTYIMVTQTLVSTCNHHDLGSYTAQLPRVDPRGNLVMDEATLTVRPVFTDDAEIFIALGHSWFDIEDFFFYGENERKIRIAINVPFGLSPEEFHRWKNADDRTEGMVAISLMRMKSLLSLLRGGGDFDGDILHDTDTLLSDLFGSAKLNAPKGRPMTRPTGPSSKTPGDAISASIIAGILGTATGKPEVEPFQDLGSVPPAPPTGDTVPEA